MRGEQKAKQNKIPEHSRTIILDNIRMRKREVETKIEIKIENFLFCFALDWVL